MPDSAEEHDDQRIRVVIADDHPVVRIGLVQLLESAGFEVVAEAGNIADARRYVRGHNPDVLVLDLSMPDGSGLDVIPEIRAESPETQIVVLTLQQQPASARQALSAGARGYVLKESAERELVDAVQAAAAGKGYLNPRLAAEIAVAPPPGRPDGLTVRQAEVLRLVALGYTNQQIGDQLLISVRTVESFRAQFQQKLHLPDRAALVRYAFSHGMIKGDEVNG
jgi:two-component system, NarL family, response regulator NreC